MMTKRFVSTLLIFFFSTACLFSQWEEITTPFTKENAFLFHNDRIFVAAGVNGVYLANPDNLAWLPVMTGLPQMKEVWDLLSYNNVLYAATEGGGVFQSTNMGQVWTALNDGLLNFEIYSLAFNDAGIFAATGGGQVYMKLHGSNSWENKGMVFGGEPVWVLENLNGNIYAGSNFGNIAFTGDNGTTWNEINAFPSTIFTIAMVNNLLYAGTQEVGIIASDDLGGSWNVKNTGLKVAPVNKITGYQNKPIAGLEGEGVFFSENDGASWTGINDGLNDLNITTLAVIGDFLYAGTKGSGMYRLPVDQIVIPEVVPPDLLNPADESENVVLIPTFQWSSVKGAIDYHLQIAKDFNFSNIIYDKDNIQDNVHQISIELNENSVYYWKVAANAPDGEKKWSEPFQFTTLTEVIAPALEYPADGEQLEVFHPVLIWNEVPGAVYYKVQVSTNEEFLSTVIDTSEITETSFFTGDLEANTVHYWIVAAVGVNDKIEWSDPWQFTTGNVSSVNDHYSESDFKLHPNPAKNYIILSLQNSINIEEILISGLSGIPLKNIKLDNINAGTIRLNLPGMSQGVYNLSIKSGEKIHSRLFVIAR